MTEQFIQLSSEDIQSAVGVSLARIDTPNVPDVFTMPEVTPVDFDEKTGTLSFPCPHCEFYTMVNINEVACSIFRHGSFFISTPHGNVIQTQQMDPHTPKNICDQLFAEKKIIGCGKPLKMDKVGNSFTVRKCDYI